MPTTDIPEITVDTRTELGKRYAARLRKAGRLPAVIYGHKQEPIHISCDAAEMIELLHRNTHVMQVAVDSKSEPCLVKDVQWDHLGTQVLHVDLTRVDLTERVTTEVELIFTGEAVGLQNAGALISHPHNTIEVDCQVINIPDNIRVDVTDLDVGSPITVADLPLPADVTCTMDAQTIIAAISIQAEQEEEEVAVETAEDEPEVITANKEGEGDDDENKKE